MVYKVETDKIVVYSLHGHYLVPQKGKSESKNRIENSTVWVRGYKPLAIEVFARLEYLFLFTIPRPLRKAHNIGVDIPKSSENI